MSVKLNFGRDVQGYNAYAPQYPTDIYTATLAASTAESITIPSNFQTWIMYVQVEPTGYVWTSRSTTAAIPTGSTLDSASSELISGTVIYKRTVFAKDVISFLTPNTTCNISVSLYAIN